MTFRSSSWGLKPHDHSGNPQSGGTLNASTRFNISGTVAGLLQWILALRR